MKTQFAYLTTNVFATSSTWKKGTRKPQLSSIIPILTSNSGITCKRQEVAEKKEAEAAAAVRHQERQDVAAAKKAEKVRQQHEREEQQAAKALEKLAKATEKE